MELFNQFILIIVWFFIVLVASRSTIATDNNAYLFDEYPKVNYPFAIISVLPLVFITAFRGPIADTRLYIELYKRFPDSFAEIPSYLLTVNKDKGFALVESVFKCVFGDNYVVWLFALASIQIMAVVYLFRNYSIDFAMSLLLFMISADYVSWLFNGMRQFTAVAIILLGSKDIFEGKYIRPVLLIILASFFHQSALLMIPVIFIVQGKAWNYRTLAFIGAVILSVLFIDRFTSILDDSLQATQYSNVVTEYTQANDNGTNPIRVLLYSAPAIVSLIGRRQIQDSDNKVINICTNMSIVSMGLYILSMVTSGIFIGRLPIYCSLFSYILIPWEIEYLFTERSRNLLVGIMYTVYGMFYYYQMHIAWNWI